MLLSIPSRSVELRATSSHFDNIDNPVCVCESRNPHHVYCLYSNGVDVDVLVRPLIGGKDKAINEMVRM